MHSSDLIPSSARPGAPTAEELLQAGRVSLAAGRPAEALRLFATAVRTDRHSTEAQTAFAQALAASGDRARARVMLDASLKADPVQIDGWLALASLNLDEGDAQAALAALDRTLALGPMRPVVLEVLGRARLMGGDLEGARRAVQHGLGLAPDEASLHALGAQIDRAGGLGQRAVHRLARAASLDPKGQSRAYYEMARAGDPVDLAALALELERAEAGGDDARRADLHFALAHGYLRGGDDRAMGHADAGNRLAHGDYDAAAHSRDVDAVLATFDATYFAQVHGSGLRGTAPVFVVGAPRAALESIAGILAGLDQFELRGDRFFDGLVGQVEATVDLPFPGGCERLQRGHWAGVARAYVDSGGAAARGLRSVDAGTVDLRHLGMLASSLPDARLVVVGGDRRDVALENYFEHGRQEQEPWTSSFADLSARATADARLLAHWRRVLPLPMLEVDAADLVAQPAVQARRLIDFAGASPLDAPIGSVPELHVGRWLQVESELRDCLPATWFDSRQRRA